MPIQPQNRSAATPKAPASPPPPPPPQVTQPPSQRSRLASQEDDAADTPTKRDIPNAKPTKAQLFMKGIVGLYLLFLVLCILGMLLNMIVTPEESALRKPVLAIVGIIVVPVVLVGVSIVYALPSVVAFVRDHNNFMPIMVVNICFGWTFLGWAISLAWAFSADVKESRQYIRMVTVREDRASEL